MIMKHYDDSNEIYGYREGCFLVGFAICFLVAVVLVGLAIWVIFFKP